jgi:general secretion pathway protein I
MAERADDRSQGFTLLEVIISFAILAIAWQVLFGSFSTSLLATERYEASRTALMLARSTLSGLETQATLAVSDTSGRFDNGFQWHVVIAPYRAAESDTQLPLVAREVTVTVSWGTGSGQSEISLTTVRLTRRI